MKSGDSSWKRRPFACRLPLAIACARPHRDSAAARGKMLAQSSANTRIASPKALVSIPDRPPLAEAFGGEPPGARQGELRRAAVLRKCIVRRTGMRRLTGPLLSTGSATGGCTTPGSHRRAWQWRAATPTAARFHRGPKNEFLCPKVRDPNVRCEGAGRSPSLRPRDAPVADRVNPGRPRGFPTRTREPECRWVAQRSNARDGQPR